MAEIFLARATGIESLRGITIAADGYQSQMIDIVATQDLEVPIHLDRIPNHPHRAKASISPQPRPEQEISDPRFMGAKDL